MVSVRFSAAQVGCYLIAVISSFFVGAHGASGVLRSATGGPHLVKLRKLQSHGEGPDVVQKSFYVGYVSVGLQAQRLQVTFDTASGQIFLPSAKCLSSTCLERRRYIPQASKTAVDINSDGTALTTHLPGRPAIRETVSISISSMDLGDGKVSGDLVREVVCLGPEASAASASGADRACAEVGIVAATQMTDVPFGAMPQDGTVGLGLGLSISRTFNFLARYSENWKGTPKRFGLFLGDKGGEIAFGGHSESRLAAPLDWLPVLQPQEGYWQVRILKVRLGNQTLASCEGGCRGILDSSASRIGVPSDLDSGFQTAIGASSHRLHTGCAGPDLHIDLEGTTLTLRSEDYLAGKRCDAQIAPLQLPKEFAGAFVLGEPILRRYYTVYDADSVSVGFGVASPDSEEVNDPDPPAGAELPAGARMLDAQPSVDQRDLTTSLVQALAMQVAVVLLLSFTGIYVKSAQLFLARVSNALARRGWLARSSGLITIIPTSELPDADECVICLGCCEDECRSRGSKRRPNWCRLRCGHQFHEDCIFEWLWKMPCCPVCRSPLQHPSSSEPPPFLASGASNIPSRAAA